MNGKRILFIMDGNENWLGGMYYTRNIVYTLLLYPPSKKNFHVYILVKEQFRYLVDEFESIENIDIIIWPEMSILKKILKKIINIVGEKVFGITISPQLSSMVKKYSIDVIFPLNAHNFCAWGLHDKGIAWIPDFQHVYYPEYFSQKDLSRRNYEFSKLAYKHNKLILSSQSALENYKRLYPGFTQGVYVAPFASMIDKCILKEDHMEEAILKYKLPRRFYMVCNQFWKHKNHRLLIEALNICVNCNHMDIYIVCTGKEDCYHDLNYIDGLRQYIKQCGLEKHIKFLGIISREEQLNLMKACVAVLQPSLFEGWGTVVEDAKALGKDIIMSDINVHYEQKNDKCIIFQKDNASELADAMGQLWKKVPGGEFRYFANTDYAIVYGKMIYEALA